MKINKIIAGSILFLYGFSTCLHAQEEGPSFSEYMAEANSLAKQKLYDRALIEINHAITQNPKSARAYKVRGNIYFAMGDYAKALKDFDKLIDLAPSNADSYVCHSIVNSALKNYKVALEDINHALSLAPKSKSVKEARNKILRRIYNAKDDTN